jgi:DNA-binding Lrp family transcriptional regulator
MTKSSKETMKTDEMKVLDALEQHAKESISELSKRCGFSPQKISKIIQKLEKNKLIWGYSAVTDENARNFKHFILVMKRKSIPFDEAFKKELIFDKLDNYSPNVKIENLYLIHGKYDCVATFYAKDLVSAKKLVDEIFKRIGKYFDEHLLFETLISIRKQGIKNPQIKNLVEYL